MFTCHKVISQSDFLPVFHSNEEKFKRHHKNNGNNHNNGDKPSTNKLQPKGSFGLTQNWDNPILRNAS